MDAALQEEEPVANLDELPCHSPLSSLHGTAAQLPPEYTSDSCGVQENSISGHDAEAESTMDRECSMCGDVGIFQDLFRCTRCRYRYQHIYCSRSYPSLGSEIWVCNWCLHEADKIQKVKAQLMQPKLKRQAEDSGARPSTTAFDFLLQIAQSSPESSSPAEERTLPPATDHSDDSVHARKRHRCNYAGEKNGSVGAMDRWQQIIAKGKLHMNRPRGIGRRYKLLADVLC